MTRGLPSAIAQSFVGQDALNRLRRAADEKKFRQPSLNLKLERWRFSVLDELAAGLNQSLFQLLPAGVPFGVVEIHRLCFSLYGSPRHFFSVANLAADLGPAGTTLPFTARVEGAGAVEVLYKPTSLKSFRDVVHRYLDAKIKALRWSNFASTHLQRGSDEIGQRGRRSQPPGPTLIVL